MKYRHSEAMQEQIQWRRDKVLELGGKAIVKERLPELYKYLLPLPLYIEILFI
jgi:hypothetical protein